MSTIMKYDEAAASKVLRGLDEAIQTIGGGSIPALESARNSANTLEVGKVSSIADALSAAETTVSRLEAVKRKVKSYMDDARQFDLDAAALLNRILNGSYDGFASDENGYLIPAGNDSPKLAGNGYRYNEDGTRYRLLASGG